MYARSPFRTALLVGVTLIGTGCGTNPVELFVDTSDVRVTGAGLVRMQPVTFSVTVDVERRSGNVSGTLQVNISYASGDSVAFRGIAECLKVEGNSAWIGMLVTTSSNRSRVPEFASTMILIRDRGGPGQDIMHAELVPALNGCTVVSLLEETVVNEGDYTIVR